MTGQSRYVTRAWVVTPRVGRGFGECGPQELAVGVFRISSRFGGRKTCARRRELSICRSSNRLWKPDFEGEAIPEQRDYDWLVIDDEDPLRHVRFTAMHSCAPHVRISVSSGWLTFRTRACAFFPPAVVNGRPTTSHSPVHRSWGGREWWPAVLARISSRVVP